MTSQAAAAPTRFDSALAQLRRWWSVATAVRPAYVLATLVGTQWLAVLVLAFTVRHNGWLYYAGGDQLWHYTGAYLLAHGHLPPSYVGYGWSIMLLPFAAVAGPNLVSALPAIVLLNTLVLLPVALLCIYGIAARIASKQEGVAARRQLIVAGLTKAEIEHRLRSGAFLPEYPGVYRVGHRAPSTEASYMAAVKACGQGALLSGRAAAHLVRSAERIYCRSRRGMATRWQPVRAVHEGRW